MLDRYGSDWADKPVRDISPRWSLRDIYTVLTTPVCIIE
jgi:hypothetical protein